MRASENETSILKQPRYLKKKVPSPDNTLPSDSDEKDSDDDSAKSFYCGVDYNDTAYDIEDEEQMTDGKVDTYFCNVVLEHSHDEDGKRLLPLKRFHKGICDLVKILISYGDNTMLMPASSCGHKPPIRRLEDVPTEDYNIT